jgi:hypothetical protein
MYSNLWLAASLPSSYDHDETIALQRIVVWNKQLKRDNRYRPLRRRINTGHFVNVETMLTEYSTNSLKQVTSGSCSSFGRDIGDPRKGLSWSHFLQTKVRIVLSNNHEQSVLFGVQSHPQIIYHMAWRNYYEKDNRHIRQSMTKQL